MKLAVIGDTQHYLDSDGRLCALEPVVNQLDRWAELFEEVVICAPLDSIPPPAGFAPYRAQNLRIEPLRKAGGNTRRDKLGMIPHLIPWAVRTRRVARQVDAVHLRCPCNIGMVAILSTWGAVRHRYAIYAGVWHDYDGEPPFFRLQRKLLGSRWFGGPVSVYAASPARDHLVPFFSPSFGMSEWQTAEPGVQRKLARLRSGSPDGGWRLVTVGRLSTNKNQQAIIRGVHGMIERGAEVRLEVLGDGPERSALEALAQSLGIAERVTFRGSVSHREVMERFAEADLNLLATRQEGYGKVLLEGMVHATVPIFGRSPVAAEIGGHGERGLVFDPDDPSELTELACALFEDPLRWAAMAGSARDYAATVTLEAFQQRVIEMLRDHWHVDLTPVRRETVS